jgi:hypothetical protein
MLTILKEAMNGGLKLCSNICHSDFKPPILIKSVIGQFQLVRRSLQDKTMLGLNPQIAVPGPGTSRFFNPCTVYQIN